MTFNNIQIVVILLVSSQVNAWFISGGGTPDNSYPEWDKLSVTFPKYNGLPQTAQDAEGEGWTKIDSCQDKSYFRGNRYALKGDTTTMLLFDSQGIIAGTQFGIPKSGATRDFYKQAAWVEDGDMLVLTAYFVHPSKICNGQREKTDYIGDSLSIQVGPTPSTLMEIPLREEGVAQTKWVKGKCFYGMGQHYWYDISQDMNCDNYFPAFLLYNDGKLNGFGWIAVGKLQGDRFEYPRKFALRFFYEKETHPKCVDELDAISTIHVYLDKRPYLNFC